MLLCDFCDMCNCEWLPEADECVWNDGHGDDEAVIRYAQEHGISVADAILLITFCCGLRL